MTSGGVVCSVTTSRWGQVSGYPSGVKLITCGHQAWSLWSVYWLSSGSGPLAVLPKLFGVL